MYYTEHSLLCANKEVVFVFMTQLFHVVNSLKSPVELGAETLSDRSYVSVIIQGLYCDIYVNATTETSSCLCVGVRHIDTIS